MGIAQKISLITDFLKPSTLTDAEIREELNSHVAMREDDNVASGMDPKTARADAFERFGDFEKSFSACRRIAQGYRPILLRLQFAALLTMAAVVAYLCSLLWETRSSYEERIRVLRSKIDRVEYRVTDRLIAKSTQLLSLAETKRQNNSLVEKFIDNPLSSPWCDWSAVDSISE